MQLFGAFFVFSVAVLSASAAQNDCYSVPINRPLSKQARNKSGLDIQRTDDKGIACVERTVTEIRDNVYRLDLQTLPAETEADLVTWWAVPQENESYSLDYNNEGTSGQPVAVVSVVDASSADSPAYVLSKRCFDSWTEALISLNAANGNYCSSRDALMADTANLNKYKDIMGLSETALREAMTDCIKKVTNVDCDYF